MSASALATEIPAGFCQCGCGEKTTLAASSDAKVGRIKGQPNRFVSGHNARVDHPAWKGDAGAREAFFAMEPVELEIFDASIPVGLCQCGCGEATYVPRSNSSAKGWVKGEPTRFKRGHISRVKHPTWVGDEAGYEAVHARLFRERGSATDYTCTCGMPSDEWAYDHLDPNERRRSDTHPYSTDLTHYRALCRSCHRTEDGVRKTECVNGHAYDEANTWIGPKGQRGCRACNRNKQRARHARLKGSAS